MMTTSGSHLFLVPCGLYRQVLLYILEYNQTNCVWTVQFTYCQLCRVTFNIPHSLLAESYVGTGPIRKSIRYHAKGRFGIEKNRYAHYFLILREGPPPPKKKRLKEDCKHYKTLKIINAGPRRIPNSL